MSLSCLGCGRSGRGCVCRANGGADESRQRYATARIQQMQLHFVGAEIRLTFEVLLMGFVKYGEFYDQGYRLSDGRAAA